MPGLTFTVPAEYDGATVQNFLRRGCGLSWRMVVKLKQVPGGISADGVALRTIDRVAAGQRVELILPEDSVRIEGVELPLSVVYEDESLLLVDKPPYLAVHPSAGKPEPTLANAVVAHFEREGQPLSFRPINRLDRNTSGLLLAAKNAHVAYAMRKAAASPGRWGRAERRASPAGRPWPPMGPSLCCAWLSKPGGLIRFGCIWPGWAIRWWGIPCTAIPRATVWDWNGMASIALIWLWSIR